MNPNQQELLALVSDWVAIPTVNPMGQQDRPDSGPYSTAMIEYLEAWLGRRGIACCRQPTPPGEANLVATLPGRPGGPTIVFDAHIDTVPASDWSDRAFRPRMDGGRIYGRGACDTKGALAAMLLAMATVAETGTPPNTIRLIAPADEEYGQTGVQAFLASGPTIDYAVVGEPRFLGGVEPSADNPFVRHAVSCCRSLLDPSRPVQSRGVNYGCHASAYAARGIPVVVIGPGDIAVAHAIDEYVEGESLVAAARIYHRIMSTPVGI